MSQLKSQLELGSHTLFQREVELDELLRSRERTVKELEEHLRAALSMLTKPDTPITALESRLASAQQETEDYRARLAKVVQRAVAKNRTLVEPKPRVVTRTKPKVAPRHRPSEASSPTEIKTPISVVVIMNAARRTNVRP